MGDERLRWGIVSTARINDRIIDAIRRSPRSDVIAVASRSQSKADAYASKRAIAIALSSYDALVERSDVDAVYISAPNHLHAELAVRFAGAGKHVLCEKPLALTSADVGAISDAANAAGVVVQEAAATRFHRQTSELGDLLRDGAIGKPLFGVASFTYTLAREVDIRLDPHAGGGALWDIGCYPVTFFQAILGDDPVQVFGHAALSPTGVDESFAAQMIYRSGFAAQFVVSMRAPASRSMHLFGTNGSIDVTEPWLTSLGMRTAVRLEQTSDTRGRGTFGDDPPDSTVTERDFGASDVYLDEITGFERMVLDGDASPYPLSASRRNVVTLSALLESAKANRVVALDQHCEGS